MPSIAHKLNHCYGTSLGRLMGDARETSRIPAKYWALGIGCAGAVVLLGQVLPQSLDEVTLAKPTSSATRLAPRLSELSPLESGLRYERCYFAALRLNTMGETYAASLGGEAPGPKVPSFGGLSEQTEAKHIKTKGTVTAVATQAFPAVRSAQSLPRAARYCQDSLVFRNCRGFQELAEVVTPLSLNVQQAQDYYANLGYQDDTYARGRELHHIITAQWRRLGQVLGDLEESGQGQCGTSSAEDHEPRLLEARRIARAILRDSSEKINMAQIRSAVVGSAGGPLEPQLGKFVADLEQIQARYPRTTPEHRYLAATAMLDLLDVGVQTLGSVQGQALGERR